MPNLIVLRGGAAAQESKPSNLVTVKGNGQLAAEVAKTHGLDLLVLDQTSHPAYTVGVVAATREELERWQSQDAPGEALAPGALVSFTPRP